MLVAQQRTSDYPISGDDVSVLGIGGQMAGWELHGKLLYVWPRGLIPPSHQLIDAYGGDGRRYRHFVKRPSVCDYWVVERDGGNRVIVPMQKHLFLGWRS